MPYVITTRSPHDAAPFDARARITFEPTRRAVATLEEARDYAQAAIDNGPPILRKESWMSLCEQAAELPESGGTVGPLPDGTVIEVAQMTREDVVSAAGEGRYIAGMTEAQMVDAFNARS